MDKWMGIESPKWMRMSLKIFKWFIYILPFVCCSIAMWIAETNLSLANDYLITAVYCLSLQLLIQLTEDK